MKMFKDLYAVKKVFMAAMLFTLFAGFATASSAAQIANRGNGSWNVQTGTVPAYWAEKGFWVDATVQNIAYSKVVTLVWTDDNWTTTNTSNLTFDYSLGNGYEVWGIDFNPLGRLDSYYIGGWQNYVTGTTRAGGQSVTIQYALSYTVNGNTYWDNNNGQNYSVVISL